MGGVLLTLTRD